MAIGYSGPRTLIQRMRKTSQEGKWQLPLTHYANTPCKDFFILSPCSAASEKVNQVGAGQVNPRPGC